MKRNILFSVPRVSIPHPMGDPDPSDEEYLEAIAAAGLDIELFDLNPYARHLRSAKQALDELELTVETVHGGHLQELMDDERAVSALMTQIRHLHLASVIDQIPDDALEPSVSTHHAPQFWPGSDVDMDDKRQVFLDLLDEGLDHLEPDGTRDHLDANVYNGNLITATVCLENVAPRDPRDYMLVTAEDVDALQNTAEELGVTGSLSFTCDVGHAGDPVKILQTMDDIQNIHLHSTVPLDSDDATQTREQFDLSPDEAVGSEDSSGIAHHLPPHVGDLDLRKILDTLDDIGYDGPLTVELHDPYRTGAVVHETADAIRTYL